MLEVALAALRLAQFAGAAILFGAPLFLVYGLRTAAPGPLWSRPLTALAAGLLAVSAAAGLTAQTAAMAGSLRAALDPAMLLDVVATMPFGVAAATRTGAGLFALVLLAALPPGRPLHAGTALVGGVALASFPWSGHGAAGEGAAGAVQLGADIAHLLAAGVWVGALVALLAALRSARRRPDDRAALVPLHAALAGFAGVGSAVVAVVVATGLVNSWFLVGPAGLPRLADTPWGQLLLLKLVVFAAMLALAAANRFRHTPALAAGLAAADPAPAVRSLRRSIAWETACAILVLALVALLGQLAPPAAG